MNKVELKFRSSFREEELISRPPLAGFRTSVKASVCLGKLAEISAQTHINQIKNQSRITYLDISNRDLGGPVDLKGFAGLKSLNAYSNKFENLDGLNSLPSKSKLQKINFYGNTIKEIDFASLLTQFPNLQYLNVENNPISAINLQKLSKEQLKILIEKIKERKFRVNSYRGTVLQDLLFYLQGLGSSHTGQAKEIAALIQTAPTESSPTRNSGQTGFWLVWGIVLLGLTLGFGYWWGKRKQNLEDNE